MYFDILVLGLALIFAGQPTCAEQYTYWIDNSCDRHRNLIQEAVEEAMLMTSTASRKLITGDPIQTEYFQRLFSPTGGPGDPRYKQRRRHVAGERVL